MRRFFHCALTAVLGAGAGQAETTHYGAFTHDSELDFALILSGDIGEGDSFELRRAMRNHPIRLILPNSPGGLLYEGLQIAAILHDTGAATYLPPAASCESSCANIFLGGSRRLARGKLGVHQFYTGDGTDPAAGPTSRDTQYTTAEIIGIMNTFETPPFVYERMFSTGDIYYFGDDELAKLSKGETDSGFVGWVTEADAYLATHPEALRRPAAAPATPVGSNRIPAPAPPSEGANSSRAEGPIELFDDTDFFGADLSPKGLRGVSLSDCEAACRSDPACAAFSYVRETRWCWPKRAVENMSVAFGTISGVVDFAHVDSSIFNTGFIEATGADMRGMDKFPDGLRGFSLAECRDVCLASPECRAFSWVAKQERCFPKYARGRLTPKVGVITGLRN